MANKFVCRGLFGLGITSLNDFVALVSKYKAVKDEGITYINSSSFSIPKKTSLVVFESVREIIRFHSQIKPTMVIVVSDTPVILKDIREIVPLDYSNERSFEFNFKEIDIQTVLRAFKVKGTVTSSFTSYDNLGYHVDRVKSTDGKLLNAYLSVSSSMPFDIRSIFKQAIIKFLTETKPKQDIVTNAIEKLAKKYIFPEDVKIFNQIFAAEYKNLHGAINSSDMVANAALKFDIDKYAVSYFRKLVKQSQDNQVRLRSHNVQHKSKSSQFS